MGVSLYPAAAIPAGMLMPSARSTAPDGWLVCDGAQYNRVDFPDLFTALGGASSPYGLPDGATFNVPNLKGKVIVGVDAAQTEFDALAETGGSKTSTAPHTHSLSAHSHTLGSHTHTYSHTHGMNTVNTRHAHNVYARNQDTGGMSANWSHFHTAQFIRVVYDTANHTHAHAGGANTLSEGVSGGVYYGGWATIDVNSTDVNHVHNFNHDHPSTNYQDESPWGGGTATNHDHATNSQSASTSSGPTGASDGPSIDATGASSAGATSGNLQPYMALNYMIKT